jgi:hypothetical protein
MQNSVAKKLFAVGSAVAMVAAFATPLAVHATVHAVGTNVSDSTGTVWMIMSDGTRRAYTSAGAFLSYGFNSWSQVVPASAEDLNLPAGTSFIPPQDGSIMCSDRGADKGTCYEVSASQKYGFTSAAVFTGLGFSFANSLNGDVSFLSSGSTLINNATMAHLPGTLVNNNGTVQLVGASGMLGIPDLATFNSWGYSFTKVVPADAADKAMTQTGVMAARIAGQLSPTALASNPSNPTVVSGNVSVSLAGDTPASGTLVSATTGPGQVGADIAHFAFSGTGTVTQVVVKRIGVSSDTSLNNVYLYQGNNRITDAGSFSNGVVTFSNSNGLFTVSGSAELSVRVDVASAQSGISVGAQLTSFTVANGSPMATSLSGNLFSVAEISNLATVQVSGNDNSAVTGPGQTINAGLTNQVLWSVPVSVGQRSVLLKYIAFKQIGSISQSAIQNLKLMIDGTQVGSTASIANSGANTSVVIFDLSGSPVTLNTGGHTLALNGDVVSGTSYTFEFSLQQAADAVFYDTNYGVNVPITFSSKASIFQLVPGTGLTTISPGTVSVQQDSTFTATQFVSNASQVVLGSWTMKAYGEDVKVQNLKVILNYFHNGSAAAPLTTDGFNNLTVTVNGGGVGSSQSALYQTSGGSAYVSLGVNTFLFGTSNLFTIPAGTTVTVQVKGDSTFDSTDTVNSVRADINTPQNSLQGVTSFNLTPPGQPGQLYTGVSLTTANSNATLAKNVGFSGQSISSNLTNQHIGSYVVQASSADGVRVTQLSLGLSGTFNGGGSGLTNGLANLYIVTPGGSATPIQPSATSTFSVNFTVAANQTATVDVYADVSNATGTIITDLTGSGVGSTSNQSVSFATPLGQTITVGTGSLYSVGLASASSPQSSFVAGGTQNQPIATYDFIASSTGGVTITELGFTVPDTGAITSVTVGSQTGYPVGSRVLVTGLSIAVPVGNAGLNVPVTVSYSKAGINGIADQSVQMYLGHVKYTVGSATVSNSSDAYNTAASSSDLPGVITNNGQPAPVMELVGSAPSLTVTSANNGGLALNEQHLIDVTVNANTAGQVQVNKLFFTVSASGLGTGATLASERLAIGSNTIGQSACGIASSTAATDITAGAVVECDLPASYNVSPSSPITFSLYGTVGGALGNGGTSSVSASLTTLDGSSATHDFSWTDVTGDGSTFTTQNHTYFVNYPSQSWSTHN